MNNRKRLIALGLVWMLGIVQPGWISSSAFAQETGGIRIKVHRGENRIVEKKQEFQLVVEVRNREDAAIAGADVTFAAPDSGPGILFADNASRLTVKTDSLGRADAGPTRSIGDGPFAVTVTAIYQGESASISVQAINQTSDSTEAKKKSNPMKWILLAAAGGAVGAVVATKKSSPGSGSTGSEGTITVGPPTVGAPQ
jgi:hypothetical protein